MNLKKFLAQQLAKQISELSEDQIFALLEEPKSSALGDYAFPCFSLAKVFKKGPNQIALDLKNSLKFGTEIQKIEAVNAYLNFFLNPVFVSEKTISEVLKQKTKYGSSLVGKNKKVMVEYSSPNTNKPLHVGHLRNDSIGMCLSNILEFSGHQVIRAILVNDRGVHICKSMLAYQKFGDNQTPENQKIKGDHFVGNFYVLFNQKLTEFPELEQEAQAMLVQWEKQDKRTIQLWKKMNAWVIQGFVETYKKFGSSFDEWFYESKFYDKAQPIIDQGIKQGVFFKSENGSLMADLKSTGLPNKTVLRADGTSIYLTNDLPLTVHKFEKFKLAQAFWVVASEQDLYFQQLFKIFELLGYSWSKNCKHLSYGMVLLPEGKMKSREGNVIDADDLMQDISALAYEEILKRNPSLSKKEIERRSQTIALAAIKYTMLKIELVKDFVFDLKQSVSFEGDSGPYLQYSYARAKSILRKASNVSFKSMDFSLLNSTQEYLLVKKLAAFPLLVEQLAETKAIHLLTHYLQELCLLFNSYYHEIPVLTAAEKVKQARLALVESFSVVLKNGLYLLNIETLDEM
ncbi:MAG: arginine--tRNA ligase [Candidatus Diapherotrites archaeon]|nr:arginine--tRNA ligase [Candidatus Diapherotrites archaeon]